ncbi:hypothetical protein Rsub_10424 [Raphidocelis subcapitata]|uniref:Uncharacterized protein n=1 Tax=Raphidocelis subcapitata TaxID=307507 RepID=A0A2V0PCC2_9CHLO|nr:hypothetical protein Rsub_10424 [Raphidocelis subcapitata]|eukprot:GBF97501.1 hypothetical protein Rsub_10424 [Raphidocelis subcapitata]
MPHHAGAARAHAAGRGAFAPRGAPAARAPSRGGRRPAGAAAAAAGHLNGLTALEAEVLGMRLLTAWNARGWRAASSDAAARGGDCTAAALELLAARRAAADAAAAAAPAAAAGSPLHLLVLWAAAPEALAPALASPAVGRLTAVEPARDAAAALAAALALPPPRGVAHDGWERRAGRGGGAALYRGNPYALTPPVLSLAGDVDAIWDRRALLHPCLWGLLITPPALRPFYLRTLSELLPARGGLLAAAACLAGDDGGGGGDGGNTGGDTDSSGDGGGGGGGEAVLEAGAAAELSAVEADARAAGGLRLVARGALPAGPGGAAGSLQLGAGDALLLFERQ